MTLKELRTAAGLTQEQLATKAGISKTTISAHEQGITKDIRPAQKKCICRVLSRKLGYKVTGWCPLDGAEVE